MISPLITEKDREFSRGLCLVPYLLRVRGVLKGAVFGLLFTEKKGVLQGAVFSPLFTEKKGGSPRSCV